MQRLWLRFTVVVTIAVLAIVGGIYSVVQTVEYLGTSTDFDPRVVPGIGGPPDRLFGGPSVRQISSAPTALGRLLFLSLVAGAVAAALTEFVKKLTPLREVFNRRAALKWFPGLLLVDPIPYGSDEAVRDERLRRAPIYFGGNLQQVSAQLASRTRQLLGRIPTSADLPYTDSETVYHISLSLRDFVVGRPRVDDISLPDLEEQVETQLDAFQLVNSGRWIYLLRTFSALTAGVLAGTAAIASDTRLTVELGSAFFGVFVGGPFSWLTRDIMRLIASRSAT